MIVLWATTSTSLLCAYILSVGFLDQTIAGVKIVAAHIVLLSLMGFVFLGVFFIWAKKRGVVTASVIRDASLGVSTVIVGLISLDVGYSAFLNSSDPASPPGDRLFDSNVWIGELLPELYFPTEKNFRLHKPGWTVTGSHYGGMYRPTLLASPVLASSVFSKKHVTISINDDGFRETSKVDGHKIVAIGDSFTFRWAVDQEQTWVELLEHSIGKPIYNMGIHDSSPKQELLLLEHIIGSRKLDLRGGLLLWMIFEGNDLEDSYDDLRPARGLDRSKPMKLFNGTIIDTIWGLPMTVQRESVFARFRDGRAEFTGLKRDSRAQGHYVVDGIASPFPLYVSPRFGVKLFTPYQITRAQSSEQYVESHPHRLPLQKTFERMEALAKQEGFRVVVIIAPTEVRLYGPEFEQFPNLSEQSHFNILISRLADKSGFEAVDLEKLLRPYAQKELLYFRDDHHWNERGHAAVADILAGFLNSWKAGAGDGEVRLVSQESGNGNGVIDRVSGRSAAR